MLYNSCIPCDIYLCLLKRQMITKIIIGLMLGFFCWTG
ncbi:hypothetical protein BMETH_1249_0 [methanotrophic bacterial endosymbiont of Bathymodiolus sp.]|nr:hypothetical protein BMETH_1249_0 [methanotrophic bacterial endosymbiont of Bathymodiolus sp.]